MLILLIGLVLQQQDFKIGSFEDLAASIILLNVVACLAILIIINLVIFVRRFVRDRQRAAALRKANQNEMMANLAGSGTVSPGSGTGTASPRTDLSKSPSLNDSGSHADDHAHLTEDERMLADMLRRETSSHSDRAARGTISAPTAGVAAASGGSSVLIDTSEQLVYNTPTAAGASGTETSSSKPVSVTDVSAIDMSSLPPHLRTSVLEGARPTSTSVSGSFAPNVPPPQLEPIAATTTTNQMAAVELTALPPLASASPLPSPGVEAPLLPLAGSTPVVLEAPTAAPIISPPIATESVAPVPILPSVPVLAPISAAPASAAAHADEEPPSPAPTN